MPGIFPLPVKYNIYYGEPLEFFREYPPETVNEQSYDEMRAFRKPFISTHVTNYYFLLVLILLHIVAVIATEIREGGSIISAMFSGKKTLTKKPE